MSIKEPESGTVWLNPGDIGWGGSEVRIKTVLSSCVALCFWHPVRKIGGMAHYMLPRRPVSKGAPDGRYATDAFAILKKQMADLNTHPGEYETKLFGGCSMVPVETRFRVAPRDVGAMNVAFAEQLVEEAKLRLIASDLGGYLHRRVLFDLSTGAVWIQRVNPESAL